VGDQVLQVSCSFTADGRGFDTYQVLEGKETNRFDDENDCPEGMDIWVPRTQDHLDAVVAHYGKEMAFPFGIYGVEGGCGGCTQNAMNSDNSAQNAHWTSVGSSTGQPTTPWFLRDEGFSEPNGDYSAGCWLGRWTNRYDSHGLKFNDGRCSYKFTSYLCSTNQFGPPSSSATLPPTLHHYNQHGCAVGIALTRAATDVGTAADGFENTFDSCRDMCADAEYPFFGLECPMADKTHCQCYSQETIENADQLNPSVEVCANVANPVHCSNDYKLMHGGREYYLGGANVGSIYSTDVVNAEEAEEEAVP